MAEMEFVPVFETNDWSMLSIAESLLNSAGIKNMRRDMGGGAGVYLEMGRSTGSFGVFYQLVVRPEDGPDARELMQQLEHSAAAHDTGTDSWNDRSVETAGERAQRRMRWLVAAVTIFVVLLFFIGWVMDDRNWLEFLA